MDRIIMSATAFTTHHTSEERISAESFETDRLERRLALLEESIADGERALNGGLDPLTGRRAEPAAGGHREQLLSNLATERMLADRIRDAIASRS
jgi:hypothetical protein